MLKEFIVRNKSVLFIGFITFVFFAAVISAAEFRRIRQESFGPELVSYVDSPALKSPGQNNSEDKILTEEAIDEFIIESSESTYSVLPEDSYLETDRKFGTVRIEYTKNGFEPMNAKAVLNQKVKWVNMTDEDIHIKQKNAFFKEFKNPLIVPANSVVEFRMYRDGVWSYEEEKKKNFGSIIILKI